jgi:RND family efflux transporter MFP subunit
MTKFPFFLILPLLLCLAPGLLSAQGPGQPPAPVVVAQATSGTIRVEKEFVGTVYFQETSLVAAEVGGRVVSVHFEQGDRVRQGEKLVSVDVVLKSNALKARQALREEVLAELSRFEKDLERKQRLHEQGTISDQEFDESWFRVTGLKRRAEALAAEIATIREELKRLDVVAPFDGVVLSRRTNLGEWLSPGSPVAEVARYEVVDVLVNVPISVAVALSVGQEVRVAALGNEITGTVAAVVPRGDVATRTFPVKVRLQNKVGLSEGMEVRLFLPTGEEHQGLLVPRDAVVAGPAGQSVFTVTDGRAVMIPVRVVSYVGDQAGIVAQGLGPGDVVVVKGQERLRDGQNVQVGEQ